jgi:hypothetical protein
VAIFRADKIYLNEEGVGISSGLSLDGGFHLDAQITNIVTVTSDIDICPVIYKAKEILSLAINFKSKIIENYSNSIDLMELVPLKFRDSILLQDFLNVTGFSVGFWVSRINDIEKLLDKYSVMGTYISYLADLIGLEVLLKENEENIDLQKKKQLNQVIDWYKTKGTYTSLNYVAYVLNLNVSMKCMYTQDYFEFIPVDWYAGDLNSNPPGLDSSYYKSPHLGVEVILNKKYGSDSEAYLFVASMYNNLEKYLESIRPINVVVRFLLLLSPLTYDNGQTYTVEGDIKACVCGDWEIVSKYLDEQYVYSDGWALDDGEYLDYYKTSFLENITLYKLGTGRIAGVPSSFDTSLENVVLEGVITTKKIKADRVIFEIILDTSEEKYFLTELGLYMNDGVTLVAQALFPSVDKVRGTELRIVFSVYF